MQSVLHALFLSTPSKVPQQLTPVPDVMPEGVLKPSAFYRERAVVTFQVSVSEMLALSNPKVAPSKQGKGEEVLEIPSMVAKSLGGSLGSHMRRL